MNEDITAFGTGDRLSGILAMPSARTGRSRTAVVLITAGLLHKPGPYRLYALLARSLAHKGFPCLRFDISGIGESGHGADTLDAEQAALRDVREALDHLVARGVAERFVLGGLCSGAEVAHRAAVKDSRVAGVIAFDGFILRNWKYALWHYLPRIVNPGKWADAIRSRFSRSENSDATVDDEQAGLTFWSDAPPPQRQLEAEFRRLANRGVQQLQVFSGGGGDCSYRRQFEDVFRNVDFANTLDVQFNRRADHMYILDSDRRHLIRTVTRWMQRRFPIPMSAASRSQHSTVATAKQGTVSGGLRGLAERRIHE